MKKNKLPEFLFPAAFLLTAAGIFWQLWNQVPSISARYKLLVLCCLVFFAAALWRRQQQRKLSAFADDICETLDDLIQGRRPENFHPYEDTLTARVQGKLLQCYDIMQEGQRQSQEDKQIIQALVSDISHQVKTPVANIRMFTGILQEHQLSAEKRAEFLNTLSVQIDKLDFLMQSLIKMSRLETGTFRLHMEKRRLYDTIAQAVSAVWAGAEQKNIRLSVTCDADLFVNHDPKWTSEALGNILDNAVKYTPSGGNITITVRPWQFYTRIDLADTGMGIPQTQYNAIFQRFFRVPEAAGEEGVGLGLYLARGIITMQKGYISVKSVPGSGTTFSVYLLN